MQKIRLALLAGTLLAQTVLAAAPALAQSASEVLVIRRPVAKPTDTGVPPMKPVEGADLSSYYWVVSGFYYPAPQCSDQAVSTQLRGCVKSGEQVDESLCPQPAPPTSMTSPNYDGCQFQWKAGAAGDWNPSCTPEATRPIEVSCVRQDGKVVDDAECSPSTRPLDSQTGCYAGGNGGSNVSPYSWKYGELGPWASSCSESTYRPQLLTCVNEKGAQVPDDSCGSKPETFVYGANLAGCSFSWVSTGWASPPNSCGSNVQQTIDYQCLRTDGTISDVAKCGPKPERATRTVADYSGCGYDWAYGEYGEWSSNCSSNAYRTRSIQCTRSDGTAVEADKCKSSPKNIETAEILSGCSYAWSAGPWSGESEVKHCSDTVTKTRPVACMRSDNTASPDAKCSGDRPIDSETFSDFTGCTYNWQPGEWSEWDNTCSDTAKRTRTASCFRSDGAAAEDSYCDAASKPALTSNGNVYTGCETQWSAGSWSDYNSTCSTQSTRTRTVECYQAQPSGLVKVSNQICSPETEPDASESVENLSGCANVWKVSPWGWNGVDGAYSSTCSKNAQQTATVTCVTQLPTGDVPAADSKCTGAKPVGTRTQEVLSGCKYDFVVSAWSPFDSTCSSAATRTRTVECRYNPDSDPTIYPDNTCVQAGANGGIVPPRSETKQNVTDCQGLITDPGFERGGLGWFQTGPNYGGWPVPIAVAYAHSGSFVSRAWAGQAVLKYNFTGKAGARYRLSWWCYSTYYNNCKVNVAGTTIGTSNSTAQTWVWTQTTGTFVGTGAPMLIEVLGTGPFLVPGKSDWNTTIVDDFLLVEY